MASVVPEADLWGCSLRVSLAPIADLPALTPEQGGSAGATHEKPKAERPAFSGNYRSSPTLTGAAVLQPKHATAGQAQLPERSHASPLGGSAICVPERLCHRCLFSSFGAGLLIHEPI